LAAACRKVSRRAEVAWRKRNLIRKIRIQASRESRKELAVARREIMRRTKVDRKRYDQDNAAPTTPKGRTSGMKGPGCNNVMRDPGLKQQLRGNERINNSGIRWQQSHNIERISWELDRKAFRLQFVKRVFAISSGIQRIKDWTLWGADPLQNIKEKETAQRGGAGNVEAPAATTTERIINRTLSGVARDERT
jgi:hypothetical protein